MSVHRTFMKFVTDNSPSILTAVGVVGTVSTAVLTGRATFHASHILQEEEERLERMGEEPLEPKEVVQLVWTLYIPALVSCGFTIAAIVLSNRISNSRAAALAAAYSLSDKAFDDYKAKVKEKIGEHKERTVRDEIAQEQVDNKPASNEKIVQTSNGGDVLCFDAFTGRYFLSDMETLRKAENEVNHTIIHHMYASLSDFYDIVGLPRTQFSDDVGWNADRMIELVFSTTIADDGRPCIVVNFNVMPSNSYYRLR